jgi:3-dehydroquinate synthase
MAVASRKVELGDRSYDVVVGTSDGEVWTAPLVALGRVAGRRVAVITDSTVMPLYRARFEACLAEANPQATSWHVVPAGEQSKSREALWTLYDELLENHVGRDGLVVALGGGVVGDLAGFAAATLHRGVPFVQVPTTLMAMVDSAIGGKTGINHARGKNLIGAFHQPLAVLSQVETLQTLPRAELSSGLAEVIKYGVIRDGALFERVRREGGELLGGSPEQLLEIVSSSARIKSEVVGEDERESGLRMILNYGHTLGHAVEQTSGYGSWLHGQAVAAGMVLAAELGEALGVTPSGLAEEVAAACQACELPTGLAPERRRALLSAVVHDKKARGDHVLFVLPRRIGEVVIEPVPLQRLGEWLSR